MDIQEYTHLLKQHTKRLDKLEDRLARVESTYMSLEKEYAQRFAELTSRFSLLEHEIKQLSNQIETTHKQQHEVITSLSTQLREYAIWTRQIIEQNNEREESQLGHYRSLTIKVLGWVVAAIAAMWALVQEMVNRGVK